MTATSRKKPPKPWSIHFFQRDKSDDSERILVRDADDLGGSSIVCIAGLSKPPRTAANPSDYSRVKRYGAEFRKRRTVLE